ncbi:MAG: LysM peptidoglycan-binding domain-containing protein [Saprospiraceae bacterium]
MSAKQRYQPVLDLASRLNMQETRVEEQDGKLRVWGTVETQYEKDQLWDEIKRVGGEQPVDLVADIRVSNNSYYTKHTVQSGESLSKIAGKYYGNVMEYNKIFEANRGILSDPDKIQPGQELVIPNP